MWGNIKMDLMQEGCTYVDWIQLAQERVLWWAIVNAVMDLWIPLKDSNFLTI